MNLPNFRKPIPLNSPARLRALHNLKVLSHVSDPESLGKKHSVMLSMDGGGYHILWTLQLLKELERQASVGLDRPLTCGDIFDVITGTSAGAITASLFLKGWSAAEIETFWTADLNSGNGLYPYRNPFIGAFLKSLTRLGLNLTEEVCITFAWFFDAPLFDKALFREVVAHEFSDPAGQPVKMGELCAGAGRGLFLLTKDTRAGFILPLGCIVNPLCDEPNRQPVIGILNSRELLLSAVLEGATSPPLQMQPFGPYIDAGFGSFNNPIMATVTTIDRIIQDIRDEAHALPDDAEEAKKFKMQEARALTTKYFRAIDSMDEDGPQNGAAFSFGTAFNRDVLLELWLSRNPLGPGLTWINWFILDVIKESAHIQNAFFRSDVILPGFDFRNFNMTLTRPVLQRLENREFGRVPGLGATSLHDLSDNELYFLTTMLEPAYVPVYQAIGEAVVRYMRAQHDEERPLFASLGNELEDYRPNIYHPDFEERLKNQTQYKAELKRTLGSRDWSASQPSGKNLASYFATSLPGFQAPFFQRKSPLAPD